MSQELNDTKEHIRIASARSPEDAEKWINEQYEDGYVLQGMIAVENLVWIVMRWSEYLKDVRKMKNIAFLPEEKKTE